MSLKQKFLLIAKQPFFIKFLTTLRKTVGGRNSSGKITIRHRGLKNKKKFKIIDIFRSFWHIPSILKYFEYDPNRRTLVALLAYYIGVCAYIIAVENLLLNHVYFNGINIEKKTGNCLPLKFLNIGTKINNLEIRLFKGSKFLKSNGVCGKLIKKNNKFCVVRLRSFKLKKVNYYCIATVGIIMNFNYYLNRYKNAGLSRLHGFKPHVRGVAMNPVDHPFGGGEGKKSKKTISMSPWGKLLKGRKTRKKN